MNLTQSQDKKRIQQAVKILTHAGLLSEKNYNAISAHPNPESLARALTSRPESIWHKYLIDPRCKEPEIALAVLQEITRQTPPSILGIHSLSETEIQTICFRQDISKLQKGLNILKKCLTTLDVKGIMKHENPQSYANAIYQLSKHVLPVQTQLKFQHKNSIVPGVAQNVASLKKLELIILTLEELKSMVFTSVDPEQAVRTFIYLWNMQYPIIQDLVTSICKHKNPAALASIISISNENQGNINNYEAYLAIAKHPKNNQYLDLVDATFIILHEAQLLDQKNFDEIINSPATAPDIIIKRKINSEYFRKNFNTSRFYLLIQSYFCIRRTLDKLLLIPILPLELKTRIAAMSQDHVKISTGISIAHHAASTFRKKRLPTPPKLQDCLHNQCNIT